LSLSKQAAPLAGQAAHFLAVANRLLQSGFADEWRTRGSA
jgi:hypothetical protein